MTSSVDQTQPYGLIFVFYFHTNLQCRPLISEAVEYAAAAPQEIIHSSVCVVQIGVKLQGFINGDGCICVLLNKTDFIPLF